MALVTTGHVALPEKAYIELQNANANIDLVSTQSRSINDSASQFSTICDIECAYSPQNTDFINVLTGEGIVSDIHGSGDHTHTHGSQALVSNGSDFQYLDTKLQNLPKDLYVQKLLELTSSNEHIIIDYRSSLCLRAKTMEGCPSGNLTTRKSTKLNSSVAKIALHCICSAAVTVLIYLTYLINQNTVRPNFPKLH